MPPSNLFRSLWYVIKWEAAFVALALGSYAVMSLGCEANRETTTQECAVAWNQWEACESACSDRGGLSIVKPVGGYYLHPDHTVCHCLRSAVEVRETNEVEVKP